MPGEMNVRGSEGVDYRSVIFYHSFRERSARELQ